MKNAVTYVLINLASLQLITLISCLPNSDTITDCCGSENKNSIIGDTQQSKTFCNNLHFDSRSLDQQEYFFLKSIRLCNIQSIILSSDVFLKMALLQNVTIHNSRKVFINPNALTNIHKLEIFNVDELNMHENGLINKTSKNLIKLKKLYLRGVNIETVNTVEFLELEEFSIKNSVVNNIEKNAIALKATNIDINNVVFEKINSDGVSINATERIAIENCHINNYYDGKTSAKSVFNSPEIRIFNNFFLNVWISSYDKIATETNEVIFEKNAIENFDVQDMIKVISHRKLNINYNKILCKCDGSHSFGSFLDITQGHYVDLLENNFCISTCNITVEEFSVEESEICKDYASSKELFNHKLYCENLHGLEPNNSNETNTTGSKSGKEFSANFIYFQSFMMLIFTKICSLNKL